MENKGWESISCLPKVTQLGRAGVWNQVSKAKVKERPWLREESGAGGCQAGQGGGEGEAVRSPAAGNWESKLEQEDQHVRATAPHPRAPPHWLAAPLPVQAKY